MKQPDFYLAGDLLSVVQKAYMILLEVPVRQPAVQRECPGS